MTSTEIARLRLARLQIAGTECRSIGALVARLGAMQAQDYAMAKWAVGVRLPGVTDEAVELALDRGEIVRTHVLRPTWHFVAAEDLRWMLALTAAHIYRSMRASFAELGLTEELRLKSNLAVAKALENGHLTREALMAVLKTSGIPVDELRSSYLMFCAELEGIVCNGARQGKQHTYALVDEKIPPSPTLPREEALARLAARYFGSHGPATIRDFQWWSGLPAADARAGLEAAKPGLFSEKTADKEYWFAAPEPGPAGSAIHFLPAFDEYIVGYTDRSAVLDPAFGKEAITINGIFKPVIVVEGKVTGLWKRTAKKDHLLLETRFFDPGDTLDAATVRSAVQPLGDFLNTAVKY